MRFASRFGRAPTLLLLAVFIVFLEWAPGRGQVNPPKTPPANRPEAGLPGGKKPTTKPGSHESSAKDERDRIAGKFPAPKEKKGESADQGQPGATAYVDVTVLDAQRQALTLTRDDFRVTIDGQPRRVVSVCYVFRGPGALDAGRTMRLGTGVVARADESRTIVLAVDEASFPGGEEKNLLPAIQHAMDVAGPDDRTAVVALPQASSVRFAGSHADLLAGTSRIAGRGNDGPAERASFYALARILTDLLRFAGPKQVIIFSAGRVEAASRPAGDDGVDTPGLATAIDAAAASRSTVHVVTPSARLESAALRRVRESTGGTLTRITGQGRDLESLGTALLGGYVLEVESNANDRNGRPHALAITTTRRGSQVLAATRWMPRNDPLPPLVVSALPPG
jgi:hypothetical protein